MRRRILIGLGLLITFLPYLGFPHSWQAVILTVAGLLIVFILVLSRPRKIHHEPLPHVEETPRALYVERMNDVDRPAMHVEDTPRVASEGRVTEPIVIPEEKKPSVFRRRKKKTEEHGTAEDQLTQ